MPRRIGSGTESRRPRPRRSSSIDPFSSWMRRLAIVRCGTTFLEEQTGTVCYPCQRRLKLGSDKLLMKQLPLGVGGSSQLGGEHTSSEQSEAGPAVHRALDELEAVHLSFDLPLTPAEEDRREYRVLIATESGSE